MPLAALAFILARALASAAGRYRMYAAAFAAIAAFAPLAVGAAFFRRTPPALAAAFAALQTDARPVAWTLSAIGAIGVFLFALLIGDLVVLLRIKSRSRIAGRSELQNRRAAVACSADVRTPTAIGYFHPRIVVPLDLAERISDEEWSAIVAHENAHLVRYDDWAKAIQSALVRLLWFSPALWWLSSRLDLERELASDERATVARDPRAYAACLLRLASDVRPHLAPAAWTARSQVAIRVERLVRPRISRPPVAAIAVAAFSAGIAGVLGIAVTLEPPAAGTDLAALRPPAIIATVAQPAPLTLAPPGPPVIGTATAHRAPAPAAPAHAEAVAVRAGKTPARTVPVLVAASRTGLAAGPCRTCELLRRPVADGPSLHRHAPAGGATAPVDAPATAPPSSAYVGAPLVRPPATFPPSVEPDEPLARPSAGPFALVPSSR